MRSYVPAFEMVTAKSLGTAFEYVSQGYQPFAGGTDVMVLFNAGKLSPAPLVGIRKIPELNGIASGADFIEIAAAVTYSQIRENAEIRAEFPLLAQAASWTGSIANQNRGTLGGNIGNASPAADSSPVLLVYEAELKLVSSTGERWLPYSKFHLGYKQLALERGELIAAFRLPRNTAGMVQYGRKVGTRKAQAISKLSFAATATPGVIRIAAGSVAPVPLRCYRTEQLLAGQIVTPALIAEAKIVIGQDIAPITDIRSTREYRMAVTENLLGEFLESLL